MTQCDGLAPHSQATNAASCEVHSISIPLPPAHVLFLLPFLPVHRILHLDLRLTAAPRMDAEYGNGPTQAVEAVAGSVSAMARLFTALAGREAHANRPLHLPHQVHHWVPIRPRRNPTTTTTRLTGKPSMCRTILSLQTPSTWNSAQEDAPVGRTSLDIPRGIVSTSSCQKSGTMAPRSICILREFSARPGVRCHRECDERHSIILNFLFFICYLLFVIFICSRSYIYL